MNGRFDEKQSFDNWVSRSHRAKANGFVGARTTGNPSWLQAPDEWMRFLRYEQAIHTAIETPQVISLCTYPVRICATRDMLGTFSSHHAMLMNRGDQWQCLNLRPRESAGQAATV